MTEVKHAPGPWQYVPGNEFHGPYVTSEYGSDICDCYTMSNPTMASIRNGGTSRPIPFMAEMAAPNARLIAAAPDMLAILQDSVEILDVAIESREELTGENDEIMRDLRDRVRAAIAKVEAA